MSASGSSDQTGKPEDRRKLVAVLYADMAGYSRLIGLDDQGTLDRLRFLRREVIDPAIKKHGGGIVQTGGDSLLIVFDSIDGAVRCAIQVQQQVPIHDGDQPPDQIMRFRIGVNLGDAIPDGTDLHGDAVNVAARLQAECPAGGICVSRSVRDHAHGRLGLDFEELGPLNLKNIARPVEAFMLRLETPVTMPKSVERSLVGNTREVLPLPAKPSIAVLAFANMSDDIDQEYFSDGITDDIITELSRDRSLFVIARNSSFTYRGRSIDVKQVGQELGVRYVVTGSVRRVSKRVRVNAQVVDAIAGNQIWADRYDRDIADVFSVQDEITAAVTSAVRPAVAEAELQRVLRKPPESLDAWETYQRGLWHMGKADAAGILRAQPFFQRAVTLDAMFAPAYAAMASTHVLQVSWFPTGSPQETAKLAMDWAHRATDIDANNPEAQAALALATFVVGDKEAAWERVSLLDTIAANSPWANWTKGIILLYGGHYSEGREALLKSLRLSPRDPLAALPLSIIPISYYFERNYLEALKTGRQVMSRYPDVSGIHRYIAASLGQLGRAGEADDMLQRAMRDSGSFAHHVRSRPPWFRIEEYEHMLDGLRKAGWQG